MTDTLILVALCNVFQQIYKRMCIMTTCTAVNMVQYFESQINWHSKYKVGHKSMNGIVIILCFFLYRAELWADSLGVLYSVQTLTILSWKVVCSKLFSEANFTSDCIHLNRMIIPTFCASTSHSHSAPLPVEPTYLLRVSWIVCDRYYKESHWLAGLGQLVVLITTKEYRIEVWEGSQEFQFLGGGSKVISPWMKVGGRRP
jgi:hypothetical protein